MATRHRHHVLNQARLATSSDFAVSQIVPSPLPIASKSLHFLRPSSPTPSLTRQHHKSCATLFTSEFRVSSFRRRACSRTAPSVVAHCLLGPPSALTGLTSVVSRANCAPWNSGKPSHHFQATIVHLNAWKKVKILHTQIGGDPGTSLSTHSRYTTLERVASTSEHPLKSHKPGDGHEGQSGWPHQQKADDRGRGHQSRRNRAHGSTVHRTSTRTTPGGQKKGNPAIKPRWDRTRACSVGSNLGTVVLRKPPPSEILPPLDVRNWKLVVGVVPGDVGKPPRPLDRDNTM